MSFQPLTPKQFKHLLHEYQSKIPNPGQAQVFVHPFFQELAPSTLKNYRAGANNLMQAAVNVESFVDYESPYTPAFAQAVVNWIIDNKGPGAARVAVGAMGSVLSYMLLYTNITQNTFNPFDRVKLQPKESIEPWTEEEIDLHMRLGDEFIKALVQTLLCTGQRLSDVVRLEVKDFFSNGSALRFKQQKTGTVVNVPIFHGYRELIREMLNAKVDNSYYLEAARTPIWNVLQRTGSQLGENDLRYIYTRKCMERGIPPLRLHGLRKSAVLNMIAAGATEFEVMAITGHKSTSSLKSYTGGYDRDAAAVRAMAKVEAHGK